MEDYLPYSFRVMFLLHTLPSVKTSAETSFHTKQSHSFKPFDLISYSESDKQDELQEKGRGSIDISSDGVIGGRVTPERTGW